MGWEEEGGNRRGREGSRGGENEGDKEGVLPEKQSQAEVKRRKTRGKKKKKVAKGEERFFFFHFKNPVLHKN